MNKNTRIIIFTSFLVFLLSFVTYWGFTQYVFYCRTCAQRCIIFSISHPKECFRKCYCPNIMPNIKPHKNNYSVFDIDKDICKLGYNDIPILQIKKNEKKKPNIILFVVDDLDELISPYWESMPFSKELFKINGTHFSKGLTSTSYCCPARCQIFSGLYPHNNGVLGMYGKYGSVSAFRTPYHLNGTRMMENNKCVNNENRTINLLLQTYGKYHTSIIGKYLNGIENDITKHIDYVPPGWDEFHVGSDPNMYLGYKYTFANWTSESKQVNYESYGLEEKDYITDVMRDKVINIINKQKNVLKDNKPLFMYVATSAPHLPILPAERHKDKLLFWREKYDEYVSNKPNYNFTHESQPEWFKNHERKNFNEEALKWNKLEWEKRMSSLYAVDEMIQTIHNKLKEVGELDNTIFGFVSDNGYNLGAHGIFNKLAPYDESIRIPYYLTGPNIKKNVIDDRLATLTDLAPTFIDIAGLTIPDYMNGISLISDKKREAVLFQFKNNIDYVKYDHVDFSLELAFIRHIIPKWLALDFHPYVGIRTKEYMFVEYFVDGKHKEYEMYDMIKDPYQMYNIYNNSKYKYIKNILQYKMKIMSKCIGSKCQ
jgi:N-acetylglucosamine-6-sulfatase